MRRVSRRQPTQGKTKGSDAGKQIHERKRHVLVDTLGLVMQVLVTAADADDRDGLRGRLSAYFAGGVQRLKKLWVDSGYRGEPIRAWVAALKHSYKIDLEVVKKPAAGFAVVSRRWLPAVGRFPGCRPRPPIPVRALLWNGRWLKWGRRPAVVRRDRPCPVWRPGRCRFQRLCRTVVGAFLRCRLPRRSAGACGWRRSGR